LLWVPNNFVELVNFVYGNTTNNLLIDTDVKCVYFLRNHWTKVFGNIQLRVYSHMKPHRQQTPSVPHNAYPLILFVETMNIWLSFAETRAAWTWIWPLLYCAEVKNEWSYTSTLLYAFLTCTGGTALLYIALTWCLVVFRHTTQFKRSSRVLAMSNVLPLLGIGGSVPRTFTPVLLHIYNIPNLASLANCFVDVADAWLNLTFDTVTSLPAYPDI